jgi:DNA-3-methyladenine glycosylase I
MATERVRCWGDEDELMAAYHDDEWGVPVHGDQELFEHLALDGFQAGLSWRTILHKREAFRRAFKNFDIGKVARFTEKDIQRLLQDKGIVRNQQKIRAMVNNALRIEEIQEEFGSFDSYIWQFTAHETIIGSASDTWENLRSTSSESDEMAADMRRRGFKFVGSTICYAFMQAVGMVDDHLVTCFRFKQR